MAEESNKEELQNSGNEEAAKATATATGTSVAPKPPVPKQLPPFKVLLHNDDINDVEHVVMSILKITHLSVEDAEQKMWEAHRSGVSLLLVTHKERAELYQEQFRSLNLTVTIEPAEE